VNNKYLDWLALYAYCIDLCMFFILGEWVDSVNSFSVFRIKYRPMPIPWIGCDFKDTLLNTAIRFRCFDRSKDRTILRQNMNPFILFFLYPLQKTKKSLMHWIDSSSIYRRKRQIIRQIKWSIHHADTMSGMDQLILIPANLLILGYFWISRYLCVMFI